jgi:hypothetical protein
MRIYGRCFAMALLMAKLISAWEDAPARTMPLPQNYREWIWLTSGVGMSYSAGAAEEKNPGFDNVFASPEAYKTFQATGTWPNRTVLMLENRNSASQESINKSGHFQTERTGLEAHVKDEHGVWAFYAFGNGKATGTLLPKTASCYSCHEQHGAVDTTFVQFYPTLLETAKAKNKIDRP